MENVSRKPRVPRRKELAESYKSLESAAAEKHRSLEQAIAERQKGKPESAEASSSFETEITGDPLALSDSPLQSTSAQSSYSEASSSTDVVQGSSSRSQLGKSPESAGINGLSGSTDELTAENSPGVGEILHKIQGSLGTESETPDVGSLMMSEPSEPPHKVIELKNVVDEEDVRQPLLLLEFNELTYTVKQKTSRWTKRDLTSDQTDVSTSRLLDNISGEARDGEILAVMGPSGSGKSTLIDALAQRIESLEGTITLNGEQVSNRLLRNISAYVMQDDLLFPMLTVEETLMFSADVRLPRSQSKAKKQARVDSLLEQLGLRRVANTIIGDEGRRGVSGGERRRVSIGIDIIHDPLLLFLDEPTSGLDSTSAYMVVRTLQNIAHTGSIVILSIHQPSYRILGLLDSLMLLAFGQKVYGGPPKELHTYFEAFGRPVPEHENSTEHALDLIQDLNISQGGVEQLAEFCKNWVSDSRDSERLVSFTDVRGAITASISRGKLVAARPSAFVSTSQFSLHSPKDSSELLSKFANPGWEEIAVLIRRSVINISRTPELFLMRLGTVVITGFLLATVFWNLDHTPKGVQERLGFFAFAMSTTYYTCADALPIFLQERYIFIRETAHNAYRKSSYTLAHAIIYVPFLALLSMAFVITIWWAVGLAGGGPGFLYFFLIVWASFWAGNSFVTLLSAVMPNVMLGYTLTVALLAYFLLLSGFFISRERIPEYWLWFHYLSIIKYPYEAVLINEFERDTCYETGSEILYGTPLATLDQSLVDSLLMYLTSSDALKGTPYGDLSPSSCVLTGHDVLQAKKITQLGKWACLGVTIGYGVFFRCLFYLVLRFSSENKRH